MKRNVKMALAIVVIGLSVIPAYAGGKKDVVKGARTAFGKTLPAGTLPEVRLPVAPRVPPTVAGQPLPNFVSAVNKALDVAVERKAITKQFKFTAYDYYRTVTRSSKPFIESFFNKIEQIDLPFVLDQDKTRITSFRFPGYSTYTCFPDYITGNTPNFIAVPSNIKINSLQEVQTLMTKLKEEGKLPRTLRGEGRPFVAMAAIEKIDKFFFIEHRGKIYVNKQALLLVNNYLEALAKLVNKVDSVYLKDSVIYLDELFELRDQQIIEALEQNEGVDVLEGVPLPSQQKAQRTAEEIKMLVEDLDPDDPLRQAIEQTLQSAAEKGYIAP